jgi:hypothetical protein
MRSPGSSSRFTVPPFRSVESFSGMPSRRTRVKFESPPRTKTLVTPALPPLDSRFIPGTAWSASVALRACDLSISSSSTTVTALDADETGRATTVAVS